MKKEDLTPEQKQKVIERLAKAVTASRQKFADEEIKRIEKEGAENKATLNQKIATLRIKKHKEKKK